MVIKRDYFDIDRFIDIGFPILTEKLSNFARSCFCILKKKFRKANLDKIINDINFEKFSKKKSTDFDGVLWKGIISDDGYKNIDCKNNS